MCASHQVARERLSNMTLQKVRALPRHSCPGQPWYIITSAKECSLGCTHPAHLVSGLLQACGALATQAPSAGDDEVAKREALAEALSNFCTVVHQGQPRRSDEQELLTASGKLSMQHLLPVYNVPPCPTPSRSTIVS